MTEAKEPGRVKERAFKQLERATKAVSKRIESGRMPSFKEARDLARGYRRLGLGKTRNKK